MLIRVFIGILNACASLLAGVFPTSHFYFEKILKYILDRYIYMALIYRRLKKTKEKQKMDKNESQLQLIKRNLIQSYVFYLIRMRACKKDLNRNVAEIIDSYKRYVVLTCEYASLLGMFFNYNVGILYDVIYESQERK